MNQKGFIPIIFIIIIGAVVATSATFGVVKYKDEITANVSKVFKPKIVIPNIGSTGGDETKEESELVEEPIIEEPSEGEENQDDTQKLQEQLRITEQKRLEAEKQLAEEKVKAEEKERIKAEQERQQQLESQRLVEEQRQKEIARQQEIERQRQLEEQRQRELEKKQAEEKERIANIKTVDEDLSQIIAAVKLKIDSFSSEKNDTSDFIVIIRNTMNKYSASSLIQQSGQQLINESNNSSFILGKLVDIGNNIIKEANSQMGSGVITSELWSLTSQLENYISQRERSRSKTESLIATFVANEKIVLEEKLQKEQEELQRKEKAAQIKEQLIVVIQEINSQLAILDIQIKEKEAEIEAEYDRLASMTTIERRVAQLIPELNSLINQWNSLLDTKEKVVTLSYKVDDYFNYGTPLSAGDRTLLSSLGISF